MNLKNGQITVGELLHNPQARALLYREFPALMQNPMLMQARHMPLNQVMKYANRYISQKKLQNVVMQLRNL